MSGSNLPQLALQVAQNSTWTPGYAPFQLNITNDEGVAPTVSSDRPDIATVSLGAESGSAYPGQVTAVAPPANGTDVATISYTLPGQAPVPFWQVSVSLDAENVGVQLGNAVPPAAPTPGAQVSLGQAVAPKPPAS